MNRSACRAWFSVLACGGLLIGGGTLLAQPTEPPASTPAKQPESKPKKDPVIDLDKLAKQPRPGQVRAKEGTPGAKPESKPAAAAPPAPAAPAKPPDAPAKTAEPPSTMKPATPATPAAPAPAPAPAPTPPARPVEAAPAPGAPPKPTPPARQLQVVSDQPTVSPPQQMTLITGPQGPDERQLRQPRAGGAPDVPASPAQAKPPEAPPAPPPPPEPIAAPATAPTPTAIAPDRTSPIRSLRADLKVMPVDVQAVAVRGGQVQYRPVESARGGDEIPWAPAEDGQVWGPGMFEVRTGLSSGATLRLGGGCTVAIDRLTRVVIHRLDAVAADPAASRIVIALQRGRATLSVTGASAPFTRFDPPVTVTTPDWIVLVREAMEITYDSAQGTRTRSLDEAPVR